MYVHVPFCSVRCGYCDFNTYTADELGEGATRASYADTAILEIERAGRRLDGRAAVDTVFFGGGTPTQLPSADLVRILDAIRRTFGLADDVEVTTEANPDSVTPAVARDAARGRLHPHLVRRAVGRAARAGDPRPYARPRGRARRPCAGRGEAGFEQLSVDLIYGTPGESMDDWRASVDQAIALEPDHISAYALIVEDGTAFARKVRRGEVVMPDDDETADKYLLADELFSAAGLGWYELSNWARDEAAQCRHNVLYWRSDNWLGIGPGAHSHVERRALVERQAPGGVRPTARWRGSRRGTTARRSTPQPPGWSGSCWRPGCARVSGSTRSAQGSGRGARGRGARAGHPRGRPARPDPLRAAAGRRRRARARRIIA